jgi:hypothetical protein
MFLDNQLNSRISIGNLAANGVLGTVANVDNFCNFQVIQTTAGITATLPTPTNTTADTILKVSVFGAGSLIMYGVTITNNTFATFLYNGGAWNPQAGAAPVANDFFRSALGATLPDGVTDMADDISHTGALSIGTTAIKVGGSSYLSGKLNVEYSNNTPGGATGVDGLAIYNANNGTDVTTRMTLWNTNVTNTFLQYNNASYTGIGGAGNAVLATSLASNANLVLGTNGLERARILATNGFLGVGTITPLSTIDNNGSAGTGVSEISTATYTVTATDHTIWLNAPTLQTVTVMAASGVTRRELTFINNGPIDKILTVSYTKLDGTTVTNIPAFSSITIQSNGTLWKQTDGANTSAAAEIVQPVNATATITSWGSFVEIGNTPLTADAFITLPVITAADLGKTITFKRVDNANFRALVVAGSGNTLDNTSFMTLYKQGGAVTIKVVSATKSEMISNIAVTNDFIFNLNQPANTTLTASATVDIANTLLFNQTTPGVTVTIPTPTQLQIPRLLILRSAAGSVPVTIVAGSNTFVLNGDEQVQIYWNISNWGLLKNVSLNDIAKVSTTPAISALTLGTATPLYTVPAGKTLNVTNIAIKVATVTGTVTTPPQISIGDNSAVFNNIMANTTMIGNVVTNSVWNQPIIGKSIVVQAGSAINVRINTAQVGATALTYTVELYGNLI